MIISVLPMSKLTSKEANLVTTNFMESYLKHFVIEWAFFSFNCTFKGVYDSPERSKKY